MDTSVSQGSLEGRSSDKTPSFDDDETIQLQIRRGKRNEAKIHTAGREKKHDIDKLTDKDMERLTITLRQHGKNGESDPPVEQAQDRERSVQYKDHYFLGKSWHVLRPEAPLDEEWFISNPEELAEDDPGFLCTMCRHIDFNVLLTRGEPVSNDTARSSPTEISLYGMARVMQEDENSCCFCRLLREKITRDKMVSLMTEEEIRDGRFFIRTIDEGHDYALRLEIELELEGLARREVNRFVVHKIEEDSQQPLAGRIVKRDNADMDKLRQWLQICEENHHSPSNVRGLEPGLTSLRVIDVQELCVRVVDVPCRYATLSYVWGKGSQLQYTTVTRDDLEAKGGLTTLASGLPQTIKDAFKVTEEAGLRYIWLDALCILQDDPMDKAKIISKMGWIYGGATLTIAASSNTDPQQGLPGMGSTPRMFAQKTAKIQDITLAVALDDVRQPIGNIESSLWNSRAWTFQERALSTRAIHFTRSQMVFKCVHGAAMVEETVPVPDPRFVHSVIKDQEDSDIMFLVWSHPSLRRFANKGISIQGKADMIMTSGDLDMRTMVRMQGSEEHKERFPVFDITVEAPRDFMSSLGDSNGWTLWDMYRHAVEDYTKRDLSRESDAVDAFSGVEHLLRRGTNTKFWFGLPSFAFEQALMWQAGGPLHLRSANNEPLFPSWSWAAWKGPVFYRGRGWKNSVLWNPVSVVHWSIREQQPQGFIDHFRKNGEKTKEEVDEFTSKVAESGLLLRELDAHSLQHTDTTNSEGWAVQRDEQHNRHIYTHDAYQGVTFTYPISLPGQTIHDRPDSEGTLYFYTHVVPIVPRDMQQVQFKQKIQDDFLQLGLNDESRSANYRPPWQRIIYHQGYRAGFLTLNIKSIPAENNGSEYYLAAVLRGSLPHAPPPPPGWDAYWDMEPRTFQALLFDEEWHSGGSKINVPDETVEPLTGPQGEDGNPHWDSSRFNGIAVFDVYDVLLLEKFGEHSVRIGAGKVSYCAFWAARPKEKLVRLG